MKDVGIAQKVVIFNGEGKILALRRSKTDSYRPLDWDLPGGELDDFEDPKTGMIREIMEEVGIEVLNLELVDITSKINDEGRLWVKIGYKALAKTYYVKLSGEHDQFEWISREEFLHRRGMSGLSDLVQKA